MIKDNTLVINGEYFQKGEVEKYPILYVIKNYHWQKQCIDFANDKKRLMIVMDGYIKYLNKLLSRNDIVSLTLELVEKENGEDYDNIKVIFHCNENPVHPIVFTKKDNKSKIVEMALLYTQDKKILESEPNSIPIIDQMKYILLRINNMFSRSHIADINIIKIDKKTSKIEFIHHMICHDGEYGYKWAE